MDSGLENSQHVQAKELGYRVIQWPFGHSPPPCLGLWGCGVDGFVDVGGCWAGAQCCHYGAILGAAGLKFGPFWGQNPHIWGVWGRPGDHLEPHGRPGGARSPKSSKKGLRGPPPRGSAERSKIAKIWQEGRPKGPKGGPGGLAMAGPILDAFLDRPWEALKSEN